MTRHVQHKFTTWVSQKGSRLFLFSYVGHTAYCGEQKLVSWRTKCVENMGDDYVTERNYCTDPNDVAVGLKAPLPTARGVAAQCKFKLTALRQSRRLRHAIYGG